MKTRPKKSTAIAAILGAAGIVAAQSTAPSSLLSLAASSQGLSQVAAADVPLRGGTYWWILEGGSAVPAPCLPLDFNGQIFEIAANEFILDQSGGEVNPRQFGLSADATDATVVAAANDEVQSLIGLITWIQTAPATSTALSAKPMGGGGGGFGPDDQTQGGFPYLTIAPTGTNQLLITVINTNTATYYLQMTPALGNTNYPFAIIANGVAGQTNFTVNIGPFADEFFQVLMATNNPGQGIAVFIDSPANGATVQ